MHFNREELQKYVDTTVPDLLGTQLKLLFVGINPGLWTAATQTHFAHPSNRFYPALQKAGITQKQINRTTGMTEADRKQFTELGLGITNISPRATAKASQLTKTELQQGSETLIELIKQHRPQVVAIAGITAYRTAFKKPKAQKGLQPELLEQARLWVVPNPSGLNAHETTGSLAKAYAEPARDAGLI